MTRQPRHVSSPQHPGATDPERLTSDTRPPSPFAAGFGRLGLWAQASEGRKGRGLVLLALVVYLPAFSGGFVWDDWILVTEPLVRRLDGIVSIWLAPSEIRHEGHYWPVVYTSFWIEHKLWGLHPAGYHAVNILLHALNSLLLWRLLVRLAAPGAWLVAAVFAVHPVHVESVAWIIERKDLLSALFYLWAFHVWLRFGETPGAGRYVLCLALFAAALLSKSIAVTLPAALLVVQWWRGGRVAWRDVVRLTPFVVLALGVTLADLAFYRDGVGHTFDYSVVERVLIAARALWIYLRQLAWPAHLPVFYPRWEVYAGDLLGWLAIVAIGTVLAVLWFARGRIGRGPLAGAVFFVLTLGPVLGFVDFGFMDIAFVADRFQYLASIGPLAVLLGAAVHCAGRLQPRGRAGAAVVAAAVLAALGALGWRQSGIYRDELAFARHTVALNPQHHFGQTYRSLVLNSEGRHEEALAAARRAVDLSEGLRGIDLGRSHFALGHTLLSQDRPVEAEAAFRRALRLSPAIKTRLAIIQLHLARSLVRQARYEDGLALYRDLLADEPGNDLAHLQMGMAFLESGRYEPAAESFRRALAVVRDPANEPVLHLLLGEAMRRHGRFDAAAAHLDRGLASRPGHVRILLARADLELDRQRAADPSTGAGDVTAAQGPVVSADAGWSGADAWLAEARERCDALIEQEPEHPLARVLLGAVLLRMQEYGAAAAALDEAFALAPSRPVAREAHRVLGEVRERQGRTGDAVRHYQGALDIYPLDAEALERLAGLHLREARHREALPLYRRLVKATPFVARAHLQLGRTLHRLGRFAEALPALDRALELAPGLEAARDLRERVREALAAPPAASAPSAPRVKAGVAEWPPGVAR